MLWLKRSQSLSEESDICQRFFLNVYIHYMNVLCINNDQIHVLVVMQYQCGETLTLGLYISNYYTVAILFNAIFYSIVVRFSRSDLYYSKTILYSPSTFHLICLPHSISEIVLNSIAFGVLYLALNQRWGKLH